MYSRSSSLSLKVGSVTMCFHCGVFGSSVIASVFASIAHSPSSSCSAESSSSTRTSFLSSRT